MGTIYRNGVPFVGSGGAGGVEVTEAEYELLPESEKMNGTIYFITDGDVSYPSASQMRYDNTESQIPSTTVQGAIDENRIEINSLQSGLNSLIIRRYRAAAGTETLTLERMHSYIAVITRLNSANADYSGLYVIQCHASSSVAAIQQSTIATLSISDTTLTFTSTATYAGLWIIDLGAIA